MLHSTRLLPVGNNKMQIPRYDMESSHQVVATPSEWRDTRSVFNSVYGITAEFKPFASIRFRDARQGFFDRLHQRVVSSRFCASHISLEL